MREITVAVVQMQPKLYEVGDNLIRMTDFVEKICLQQPVDLIIFPELITTIVGFAQIVESTDANEPTYFHAPLSGLEVLSTVN